MISGCFTAIVTPFNDNGVDYEGLNRLVDFQIQNGITGILAVGTTGESPTLTWQEHNQVIESVAKATQNKVRCIGGTGSNNTGETLAGTQHAAAAGVDAVLLVDPYYNGPSSLEIRKEYVEPVARAFPDIDIIPYVIPGRTGAQLLPEDIAVLAEKYPNVRTVKEATGNIDNMKRTRTCCGPEFTILSGDDPMTLEMMRDPEIKAAGVISVVTNVVPKAVADMVRCMLSGDTQGAETLHRALTPLFGLVTVKTVEKTAFGEVTCRARNPLAIKTLMTLLGMPSGGCRQPLGKMTRKGLDKILETVRAVYKNNPEILQPVADAFGVDVHQRLTDPIYTKGLCYDAY
jgi:4-hydroxy-tetrahydrodipicolinate synthase